MKKYNSKIDSWMLAPIVIGLGAGCIFMIILNLWVGFTILFATSAFIAHVFLTTYYQIDKNILRIKSGLLVDAKIDIMSFKEIAETRDAISAPALSFDRLYLKYNKTSDVIVSPKDKEGFINAILEVNPSVKIVRRHL